MTTIVALLVARCGLSHREAAAFLGVRHDTIKSWSAGRNPTPAAVLDELRRLYAQIERAAAEQIKLTDEIARENGAPVEIALRLARSDAEARERGWPCVGAQAAAYGIVVARGHGRFVLVQ